VDQAILRGITRTTLIDLLAAEGIELVERPFTVEEAQRAREAFLTSATSVVMPVVAINGRTVGNGNPGILTLKLRENFHKHAAAAPA
jgi:D-alanine transaminase